MADLKISQLGAASALGGAELLAGVQGGSNVRITPAQILTYMIGAATLTEAMQDMIAAFLAAGNGISLSYNDAGNGLTIASSNPKSNVATSDPTSASDGAAGFAIDRAGSTAQPEWSGAASTRARGRRCGFRTARTIPAMCRDASMRLRIRAR
jgi:hypothetical protein